MRDVRETAAGRRIAAARSLLFVPGDRPERFSSAESSGADVVIVDLEDAVAAESKDDARENVRVWLAAGHQAIVRVNARGTACHEADLAACADSALAVMIPKAESPADWAGAPGCLIVPLLETAVGLNLAAELLSTPQVVRAAFGSIDLAVELGVDPDDQLALQYCRSRLVLASALAAVTAPVDGVTAAARDVEALVRDVAHARRLGFTAKLCIHPAQIQPTHEQLRPLPAEVEWATRVLGAASGGASSVGGAMVDAPVRKRAAQIVDRHQRGVQT